tara:strand:- start:591 stop:971 length:381 start_codon:yes stop_codon:yes gene_type:complete
MKKIIPQWPYVDYKYREADENAVHIHEILDYIYEKEEMLAHYVPDYSDSLDDNKHVLYDKIEMFGIYVPLYENRIQRYRNTIEMAYEFMAIGSFAKKTPQKTIKRFKNVITRVKETVRRNKHERNN